MNANNICKHITWLCPSKSNLAVMNNYYCTPFLPLLRLIKTSFWERFLVHGKGEEKRRRRRKLHGVFVPFVPLLCSLHAWRERAGIPDWAFGETLHMKRGTPVQARKGNANINLQALKQVFLPL